jgi:hypothetical protein
MNVQDATAAEIDAVMNTAWEAFQLYRQTTLKQRAKLMRRIAKEMDALGDHLIQTAMRETNLPEARLRNERSRTQFQLISYADAAETGTWLEVRIDTADTAKGDPDIRKWQVPLGPVVVFGASNFPFAYSTAGGDTATALAAGCPVIVKAHPAHAETSELVAQAIARAVKAEDLPAASSRMSMAPAPRPADCWSRIPIPAQSDLPVPTAAVRPFSTGPISGKFLSRSLRKWAASTRSSSSPESSRHPPGKPPRRSPVPSH